MQQRFLSEETHRFADLAAALMPESADAATMLLDRELRIRGVNSAYEAAYLRTRKQIVGRFLFDVFPDNPDDPRANGVSIVAHALRQAMSSGGTATVPIVRYDIPDPNDLTVYLPRLWAVADTAIYDPSNSVCCTASLPSPRSTRRLRQSIAHWPPSTASTRWSSCICCPPCAVDRRHRRWAGQNFDSTW
jgi:PAS domain-containing protein